MAYRRIILSRDGDAATITLNEPKTLNALHTALMDEVAAALDQCAAEGVRALVLTGTGRGFCAGQNLNEDREESERSLRSMAMAHYWPVFEKLREAPFPTVAAVNGIAAGAGFSLALACDIVLAAQSAQFVQLFSRIGLIPDLGSTYWLPRLLGRHRALAMMLTTEPVGPDTMKEWGVVHEVVEDAKLPEAAAALAAKLAQGPTRTYAATRKAVDAAWSHDFKDQFEYEMMVQAEMVTTADVKEGIAAFLEKRPAKFTGS